MNTRQLYLDYLKQGLPPKEAAKMVQRTTGRSAVTGKPIIKQGESHPSSYKGQYG